MKKIFQGTVIMIVVMLFETSCLKSDLPKLPLWEDNFIQNIFVEYRYNGPKTFYDEPVVAYQKLVVSDMVTDTAAGTIAFTVTIPNPVGTFTAEERGKVSQEHLWVYMDISTAAVISPVGATPRLGDPTDLSVPQTYEVTAANGQKKTWTISVVDFIK